MKKKEGDLLIRELKQVVIKKCEYLLSKKIILENEVYSLIKLFFKGYFEIDYELSFVDLVKYIDHTNLTEEIKDRTTNFLRRINTKVYSGIEFTYNDFHIIIKDFKELVEILIGEKEKISLLKVGLKHALKTSFVKGLFIKKKNIKLEDSTNTEKKYSSIREKLIDNLDKTIGTPSIDGKNNLHIKEDVTSADPSILNKDKIEPVTDEAVSSDDLFKRYGPNNNVGHNFSDFFDNTKSNEVIISDESFSKSKSNPKVVKKLEVVSKKNNKVKPLVDVHLSESDLKNIDWSSNVSSQPLRTEINTPEKVRSIVKEFVEAEFYEDKLDTYLDNKKTIPPIDNEVHEKVLLDAEDYMNDASEKLKKVISGVHKKPEHSIVDKGVSFHSKINHLIDKMHGDIAVENIKELVVDYKKALELYKLLTKKEKKLFYDDLMSTYNLINKHKQKNKIGLI